MSEHYNPLDDETMRITQDSLFELAELNTEFLGYDATDPSIVMGVFVLRAMSAGEEFICSLNFGSGLEVLSFKTEIDEVSGKSVFVLEEAGKEYSQEALDYAASILHAADVITDLKD